VIYSFGCKAPLIAPHLTRASFRSHAACRVAALPASFDLRVSGHVAAVKDQGMTGSCVGHSSSGATETAFGMAGDPLGFIPSEADMYRGARSLERAKATALTASLPHLVDEGAMTEDMIAFIAQFGIRPRGIARTADGRNSDVELATVNDELGLGDLEQDSLHVAIGPWAIDPGAADMEHQVQASLVAGFPVRHDGFADEAFQSTNGNTPIPAPDTRDPQGGGHATYLVGYGPGFFWLRNSWGTGWAAGGDCKVSTAFVRAAWGLYPWAMRRA
jgi:hypothetical protein